MRISDWSSDVCSSDLSGHTCAVLEQLLEEAAGATEVLDAVIAQSESQAGSLWRLRENISEGQKRSGVSIKHDISVPISNIDSFLARAGSALTKSYPGIRLVDRKSTRLNSSHSCASRMPSSACKKKRQNKRPN